MLVLHMRHAPWLYLNIAKRKQITEKCQVSIKCKAGSKLAAKIYGSKYHLKRMQSISLQHCVGVGST